MTLCSILRNDLTTSKKLLVMALAHRPAAQEQA